MSATAALLLKEQLQQSLDTYEEDAEYEEDELAMDINEANAHAYAANQQLRNGMRHDTSESGETDNDIDEEPYSDDEDAEGEDDDEMIESIPNFEGEDDLEREEGQEERENEDEDDEDAEGVGAVKIQPGITEEDDEDEDVVTVSEEEDDDSIATDEEDNESKDSSDVEVEAEWDPAANEDEEEGPINPNRCIFCQMDEEHDPSEHFEHYLACDVCGDNAHQQCARDSGALNSDEDAEHWICPECVTNNLRPDDNVPDIPESTESTSPKLSRDRVPGDLLPSHRGTIKPDSHSVFNQLITPDDPMDGSRLLRKRKTASLETELEPPTPARRRTREKANGSVAAGSVEPGGPTESSGPNANEGMEIDSTEPTLNDQMKKVDIVASSRASRSLRPKPSLKQPCVSITERNATTLKVKFVVDSVELQNILSKPARPQKKRRPTPARRQTTASSPVLATASTFIPSGYTQPFYSLHEKEVDEMKSKPYGGILTEAEADTSLTLPKPEHRKAFDEARQKAEAEWNVRVKRAAEVAALSGIKKPRKVSGPASQIEYIEFGQYQIDIWYAAPYPEEYSRNKALFICEFCLKYMESDIVAWRHKTKCHHKHPPGDEIYRDGKIMMFEVDGRKNPLYCQNLCLLAKLFLGSKTLYYDVEPFLFYVMTEYDEYGCHFVGYFSKEKRPSSLNNVSCILVLPIHQRKGYGHLLIDFSYLLTRVEKKTGSPEKPLSDMGLVSYRNYWRLALCYYLRDYKSGDEIPSVRRISEEMGLTPDDVISALDALGALLRDAQTGTYAFRLDTEIYQAVIKRHEGKGYAKLNPKGLIWTPYIMGRGNASTFEHAPPLNGIGHHEDEDEESNSINSNGQLEYDQPVSFNGNSNGDMKDVTESVGRLSTMSNGGTSTPQANGVPKKLSYFEAAASIPPTRFEVFPPLPANRRTAAASRPSAARPGSAARPRSSLAGTPSRPRVRSRPSGGSVRRSSAARPRSNGSRRKTGGTGRGPGRWPKGTTKKDFGDADSGPGLPPALVKARSKLGNEVLLGEEEADSDADTEQQQGKGKAVHAFNMSTSRPRRGLGKPLLDANGKGVDLAFEETEQLSIENGDDIAMDDIDAEGDFD